MVFTASISHPKEFSVVAGNTELAREIESINQSIKLLLTSAKGELFGDPSFGSRLLEYIFEYSGETLYSLLQQEIIEVLTTQDTRVSVEERDITFNEDGTTLKINIKYSIKYTNYSAEMTILVQKEEDQWAI